MGARWRGVEWFPDAEMERYPRTLQAISSRSRITPRSNNDAGSVIGGEFNVLYIACSCSAIRKRASFPSF